MGETQTPMAMGATMVAGSAGDLVTPKPQAPRAITPAPVDALEGTLLLERYRILERLGAGGMGVVYLAEHVTIRKRCAIKVLSDEFANKPDIVDRFLQEARAASMIAHENVVEITDFGQTPSGSVFFVMEMLQGEDLSATIHREGALPWERVRPMMLQICRALQAAHDSGIIHRDMKPENCFRVERSGTKDFIKVLDFGIAKVTSDEGEGKGLTKTGMIFGTPEYMSPEQAQGQRVDHRADIYAVGVILYELLTGQTPFTADTFMGVLSKHMFEVPPSPSAVAPEGVKIPRPVEAVILKALQKDPNHRFGSMTEMMAAIDGASSGKSVAVVAENIVKPPSGPFLGFSGETDAPERSGSSAWIVLTIAVLVTAALGALLLIDDDEVAEVPTTPVVAKDAPPAVATPPVKPEAPTQPEAPTTVKLTLTTNVDAEIFDPDEGVVLGTTNSEEGIPVVRSSEARTFVLRADGYEEQRIQLVLAEDQKQSYELDPLAKAKKGKKAATKKKKADGTSGEAGSGSGGSGSGGTTSGGSGGSGSKGGSLGLKDPFGGVGK
ncbi:MAG: serine/threonine-protein kinase [Nannocystaceae bacterium]